MKHVPLHVGHIFDTRRERRKQVVEQNSCLEVKTPHCGHSLIVAALAAPGAYTPA
jgi:hypothetical protein